MRMHTDSSLIDALGGTSAVARLCEVTPPSVSEWRRSGIPKARRLYLKAVKPDVFDGPAQSAPPEIQKINTPIHQAIKFAGSQAKLAGLAGCSQQAIAKLAIGKSKRPSAELAVAIHRATKGVVTVHDLRPDIFGPAPGVPPEIPTPKEAA